MVPVVNVAAGGAWPTVTFEQQLMYHIWSAAIDRRFVDA
jgi:hypothetical protein